MKSKLNIAILVFATVFFQTAKADQIYSYTEGFTNPADSASTFVLSGTFTEAANGVLKNISSSILANGTFTSSLNVTTLSGGWVFSYPQVLTNGLPLQIDGTFVGPGGNLNSITSCGQVLLNGGGCNTWQKTDSTVPSQGLTDIRTVGPNAGGQVLTSYNFAQTSALQISPVPEPSTWVLTIAGLALIALRRRSTQQQIS